MPLSKIQLSSSSTGRRNLVMNGAMRISQRHGTSNGGTSSEGYKLTDRWKQTNDNTSATWSHTQSTDVPSGQGFAYSYKIAPGSADTSLASNCQIRLEQRWEGQDLQHLKKGTPNAESTTLSFWVKSVQTGTFVVNLQDTDNSRLIAKTYTVNTSNTWEKKVINFAGDTTGALTNDNNLSMVLHFYLSAGSNYTSGTLATSWASITNANRAAGQTVDLADSTSNAFYLTGVQWETGDAATEFEHLTFAQELSLCQRYYAQTYGYGVTTKSFDQSYNGMIYFTGTGNYGMSVQNGVFPVEMRADPTVTTYGHAGTANRITYWNGSESTHGSVRRNTRQCTGFSFDAGTNTEDFYSCGMTWDAEL